MSEAAPDESVRPEGPTMGIPSPGYLLSRKREEYGWSRKDVAHALHLSERQVEAIEADDYASLPGKTYIMGYWRSYSQLLELPIEESIQVHRANLNGDAGVFALASGHNQVQGMEERSRKRAAILFGMLLAAFLVAVWYWQDPDASLASWIDEGMQRMAGSHSDSTAELPLNPTPLEVVETASPEQPADASVLALPEPNFAQDQEAVEIDTRGYEIRIIDDPLTIASLTYQVSEASETEAEASPGVDAGGAQASDGSAAVAASGAEAVATAEESAPPAPEPAPEPEPTPPEPTPPEPEVAAAPPPPTPEPEPASSQPAAPASTTTGDNRIVFQVSKESWIDVRDSSGERLIYRTVNRGEDIRLAGVPPYSVFIGSAEGVSVQYQGREVPFKVHESGLFARFEVGAQ